MPPIRCSSCIEDNPFLMRSADGAQRLHCLKHRIQASMKQSWANWSNREITQRVSQSIRKEQVMVNQLRALSDWKQSFKDIRPFPLSVAAEDEIRRLIQETKPLHYFPQSRSHLLNIGTKVKKDQSIEQRLTQKDMWAVPSDASVFIHPYGTGTNRCSYCDHPQPNFHFFDPDDPSFAFIECFYDRAAGDLYVSGANGDLLGSGHKVGLKDLWNRKNEGDLPDENLYKAMMDHLLAYFHDWTVSMKQAGYPVPAAIRADFQAWADDFVGDYWIPSPRTSPTLKPATRPTKIRRTASSSKTTAKEDLKGQTIFAEQELSCKSEPQERKGSGLDTPRPLKEQDQTSSAAIDVRGLRNTLVRLTSILDIAGEQLGGRRVGEILAFMEAPLLTSMARSSAIELVDDIEGLVRIETNKLKRRAA